MAKNNKDMVAQFAGLTIIHQKISAYEVGRHQHEVHEFFLPLQGEITVTCENKVAKAGPGKILYVPPNADHSFSSTALGSGERIIWLIEDNLWQNHTAEQFQTCTLNGNSLVKELLFFLLINQKVKGAPYFISALVQSLVESMSSAVINQHLIFTDHIEAKVKDPRIRKSILIIDTDLAEINITNLAKESGLSTRNFNRLFLQEVGIVPKNYLILRRLKMAKKLLRESTLTVTDISLEIGYNSLSKFIETFKRFEGLLPSDFRANITRK